MANRMRKVWDLVANPADILEFAVDSSVAVEIGDLMWLDTDDVKPASATGLWTGSAAGTYGNLARKFVGVAMSAHVANEALVTTVKVACRGTFKMTLTSAATFEIGDLVRGSQDGANSYLLDQEVVKITSIPAGESDAIGKVQKRYATSVSEVEVQILGSTIPGGGNKAFTSS